MKLQLILLSFLFSCISADYYEDLELPFEATAKDIKKAYRKLSLKYHPDKNQNDAAAQEKFQKVARAYEILSNDEKRQVYDLDGDEGITEMEAQAGRPASPFDHFFGGGGGGKPTGPDASINMKVTLEELYNGAEKKVSIKKNVICPKCRGTGAKDGKTTKCHKCDGAGHVIVLGRMGGFTVQMQQECPVCSGRGKSAAAVCPHCDGHKVVEEKKVLEVEIERGMPSNHHVTFEKESEQKPGMIPGNIVLMLKQSKHGRFRRANHDLHYELNITLQEALLGYSKTIEQLDGRMIEVVSENVIQPFEIKVLEGEGMPHHNYPSETGDLHVKHTVIFPSTLSSKQQELVKNILEE